MRGVSGGGFLRGLFTANTMSSAIEAMGMSLPETLPYRREDPRKDEAAMEAGQALLSLMAKGIRPRT